jgi:hypothetical protein
VTHNGAFRCGIALAFGATLLIGAAALVRQIVPITDGDSRTTSASVPLNSLPAMMLLAGGSLATDGSSGLIASELPSGRQLGQVTIGVSCGAHSIPTASVCWARRR